MRLHYFVLRVPGLVVDASLHRQCARAVNDSAAAARDCGRGARAHTESPDWGNSYTGGQNQGGIKKKTKEQLLHAAEKADARLKLAQKEAEEAKAAADKAVKEEEAAAKLTSAEEGRSENQ